MFVYFGSIIQNWIEGVTESISILQQSNTQVQVEVEEREVDEDGNVLSSTTSRSKALTAGNEADGPAALIRDSSRNRLQRLGALYSDTENLSSPIHRNESRFDEENIQSRDMSASAKLKGRFAKLADLANSINSWEDESFNADGKDDGHAKKVQEPVKPSNTSKSTEPKIVGMCPRKNDTHQSRVDKDSKAAAQVATTSGDKGAEKNIRWDPKVMNALESQGFKRRETTTTHLVYDYKDGRETSGRNVDADKLSTGVSVKKVSSAIASKIAAPAASDATVAAKKADRKSVAISKGIVSGRTAIFENPGHPERRPGKPQVDPAEMSLRDRLALFEKNKGTALIPKAALGMSVSAKQIAADHKGGQDVKKPIISVGGGGGMVGCTVSHSANSAANVSASKVTAYNKPGKCSICHSHWFAQRHLNIAFIRPPVFADSHASGSAIQQTMAALLSNTTTISESQISANVRKTREEEMNVLLNRFNKQSDHQPSVLERNDAVKPSAPPLTPPPPPPPPMPKSLFSPASSMEYSSTGCYIDTKSKNHKRRSGKWFAFDSSNGNSICYNFICYRRKTWPHFTSKRQYGRCETGQGYSA